MPSVIIGSFVEVLMTRGWKINRKVWIGRDRKIVRAQISKAKQRATGRYVWP